jgi:hypothetical protein
VARVDVADAGAREVAGCHDILVEERTTLVVPMSPVIAHGYERNIPHVCRLDDGSQMILIHRPRRGEDPGAHCVAALLVQKFTVLV